MKQPDANAQTKTSGIYKREQKGKGPLQKLLLNLNQAKKQESQEQESGKEAQESSSLLTKGQNKDSDQPLEEDYSKRDTQYFNSGNSSISAIKQQSKMTPALTSISSLEKAYH